MDYLARAQDVLETEIQALQQVKSQLGEGFTRAVDMILDRLEQGGKIVVTGVGKSLHIGQKLAATLASTGATSVTLNPTQALHGDLGMLCPHDVLLALSYSGESDELVALLPIVKRAGLPIVSVTGQPGSSLANHSDVIIPVTVSREACPFNMAPTSSTTVTLAIGDALAMVLLEARGFAREDYAKLHPGGAIGRALITRIADIMRSGDRMAVIDTGATVRDAVLAMTRARSGSAMVTDAQHRLAGILTDGDLRRGLTEHNDVMAMAVTDLMTTSPLTLQADELAVDALRLLEQHDVDDIPVLDAQAALVGAIDIVDLPKVKVI